MENIILYHVSPDLRNLDKVFYPQIPTNLIKDEDRITPRVCFSDSIEGCVNAMGNAQRFIDEKTGKAEFVLFVFKCNLDDNNLISWKELYESGRVPDAAINHEYWYTKEIRLRGKRFEILNMLDAYTNPRVMKIIPYKYRGKIENVLEKYGVCWAEILGVDTCELVNNFIIKKFGKQAELIIAEIAQKLTIEDLDDNSDIYEKIFEKEESKYKYIDWDEIGVYSGLRINDL
ncbi:hypothetical protein [Pseudobutyrivibrio sp.]